MSFINQLQNLNLPIEEKQKRANDYVNELNAIIQETQTAYAGAQMPKYLRQRVNKLQSEINQIQATGWYASPEMYKEGKKTYEQTPEGKYIEKVGENVAQRDYISNSPVGVEKTQTIAKNPASEVQTDPKITELKQRVQEQYSGKARPAEEAAKLSVLAAGREQTAFGKLVEQRRQELLVGVGKERETAHYVQYRGPTETETKTEKGVTTTTTTKGGVFGVQISGERKDTEKPKEIQEIKEPSLQEKIDLKFENKIDEFKEAGQYLRVQRKEGTITQKEKLAGAGLTIAYIGTRALKGVVTPIVHPIETAKGFVNMFVHPIKTGKEMFTAFKEEPLGMSAEFLGQTLTFKGAETIAKPIIAKIPLRYEKVKVKSLEKSKAQIKYENILKENKIDILDIKKQPQKVVTIRTLGIEREGIGKGKPILTLITEKNRAIKETPKVTSKPIDILKKELWQDKAIPEKLAIELETIKGEVGLKRISEAKAEKQIIKAIKKEAPGLLKEYQPTKVKEIPKYGFKTYLGKVEYKNPISLENIKGRVQARTATGTEVLAKNVLKTTAKERQRIGYTQEIIRLQKKEKGLKVRDVVFDLDLLKNKVESSKAIEKVTKKYGGVFFGTATNLQVPEGFRMKIGDVDVYFPKMTEKRIAKRVIPAYQKALTKAGEDIKISETKLEILTSSGEKVLEAKPGRGKITGDILPEGALGFDVDYKRTVKFGKARATRAGEQLKRKGMAATYFRGADLTGTAPKEFAGPGVYPRVKRTKDLPGFITQSAGITAKNIKKPGAVKTSKALNKYFETFNKEQQNVVKEMIKEGGADKVDLTNQPKIIKEKPQIKRAGNIETIKSFIPKKEKIVIDTRPYAPKVELKPIVPVISPKQESQEKKEVSPSIKQPINKVYSISPTIDKSVSIVPSSVGSPISSPKSEVKPYTPSSPTTTYTPASVSSPSPTITYNRSYTPSPTITKSPYIKSPSPTKKYGYTYVPRSQTTTYIPKPYDSIYKPKKKSKFSLFVRRRGKFKKMGEFESAQEGMLRGKQISEDTLAASFKLQPETGGAFSDVRSSFSKFLPMNKFYSSRKEPGVFVQKREQRLGRRLEVAEIQQSKRLKTIWGG